MYLEIFTEVLHAFFMAQVPIAVILIQNHSNTYKNLPCFQQKRREKRQDCWNAVVELEFDSKSAFFENINEYRRI